MSSFNFDGISTPRLVEAYNHCALLLGSAPVNKFSDRATAERRTRFILSQVVDPAKRPAPFNEAAPLPGGARALDALKPALVPVSTNGGITPGELYPDRQPAAVPPNMPGLGLISVLEARDAEALVTVDRTPTPPVAGKTLRWRKPKRVEPQKVAYRPRPGSHQATMYDLLTRPQGVTAEDFCAEMAKVTTKPTMLKIEQTWSNIGYLFVTLKGYGLDFDGTSFRLLVPADERDSVKGGR